MSQSAQCTKIPSMMGVKGNHFLNDGVVDPHESREVLNGVDDSRWFQCGERVRRCRPPTRCTLLFSDWETGWLPTETEVFRSIPAILDSNPDDERGEVERRGEKCPQLGFPWEIICQIISTVIWFGARVLDGTFWTSHCFCMTHGRRVVG